MTNQSEEICPYCHKQYKSLPMEQGSREILFFYCQLEGESDRIDFPRCSGDIRFCDRKSNSSIEKEQSL